MTEDEIRADERERIATAIEKEYESWRTLDSDGGPPLPKKAPLHSQQWFVERAYASAAHIARAGGQP